MKRLFKGVIPFTIGLIILLGVLLFVTKTVIIKNTSSDKIEFNNGWNITTPYQIFENVSLKNVQFSNLKKGDVVTFTNNIPTDIIENQTLMFNTYLSSVNVMLDGENVYQYGPSNPNEKVIIGSGCHFVIIPEKSAGKNIKITVTAMQDNAFTNMEHFSFVPTTTAYSYYINQNVFGLFISIFLLVLGIVLTLTSAFTVVTNKKNLNLTYIGLFSLFMGIWSMNNIKMLQIFNLGLGACTSSEYFSLFAAAIPTICLFMMIRKDTPKPIQMITRGIAIAFSIFLIVTSILHFTMIVHYSQVLTYFHLMVALTIVFMFISGLITKKKRSESEFSMKLGFYILCLSFIGDILRFNVQKYLFPNNDNLYESFIPLGTLIFIILLLYSYITSTLEIIQERTEKEILSHLAYHDGLCSIYNRAKFDQDFEAICNSDDEFTLVNMDLNGLKKINDSLGHTAGDKLLKTFSEILEEAFNSIGTCYRMGGDEFYVIVPKKNVDKISISLDALEMLCKERSSEQKFEISTSYGLASRSEAPNDNLGKIITLADERMYKMKVESKRARV